MTTFFTVRCVAVNWNAKSLRIKINNMRVTKFYKTHISRKSN